MGRLFDPEKRILPAGRGVEGKDGVPFFATRRYFEIVFLRKRNAGKKRASRLESLSPGRPGHIPVLRLPLLILFPIPVLFEFGLECGNDQSEDRGIVDEAEDEEIRDDVKR